MDQPDDLGPCKKAECSDDIHIKNIATFEPLAGNQICDIANLVQLSTLMDLSSSW